MEDSILKRFPIGLVLFGCSVVFSQVNLLEAPKFSEVGHTVKIRAIAENDPVQVRLTWTSNTKSGYSNMTLNPASGYWSATIPAQAVQGTELNYAVVADYDQGQTVTSPDCILYICPKYTTLTPQTMVLEKTIVTEKKWNSNDDAFGLLVPADGSPTGPASIAYYKSNVYLLDSVKGRIVRFNNTGQSHLIGTVPTLLASDLVIDPTDDSLLVISQLEDKIYRFNKNGKIKHTRSVPMRKELVYPSKFTYESSDGTLFGQDLSQQSGLVGVMREDQNIDTAKRYVEKDPQVIFEAQGNKMLLNFEASQKIFAITFDRPVICIEEALADSNGIIWVLYTLQGDYRMRRLARVDSVRNLVQVAETDIWFAFDATRRMAVTPKGVVLLAGDMEDAKIVSYDYKR